MIFRLLLGLVCVFFACDSGLSQDTEMRVLTRVGTRKIEEAGKEISFPWYRVKADHQQIRSDKIWSRIPAVEGSKTAFVGSYGETEILQLVDDEVVSFFEPGMQFLSMDDKTRLKVGPGKVRPRHWYFDEKKTKGPMRFRSENGFQYIVCLDREPVSTFKYFSGKPGFNLNTELDHISAIIEVEHTYDWRALSDWEMISVSPDSLVSFRSKHEVYDKPTMYFEKGSTNKHKAANKDFEGTVDDEILNRLVYALRSCNWKEVAVAHKFGRQPPVSTTKIVLLNAEETQELQIDYDNGAWIMSFDGKQYTTGHPSELFEVRFLVGQQVGKER